MELTIDFLEKPIGVGGGDVVKLQTRTDLVSYFIRDDDEEGSY